MGVVPPPPSQVRPPRPARWLVERARLRSRIAHDVTEVPLTLLRAPAGTGKTVAAAEWARRHAEAGRPVAWMTVTDRDNHPGVFWSHLQMALATIDAHVADGSVRTMYSDAAEVDSLSAQVLRREAPVALVIDGVDRLHAPAVHDEVRRLLDAAGDALRIVMTSRVEPALPLDRYRVENRVAELDAEHLALGADEVGLVLARHRLRPSSKVVDEVLRRTEGWAAGVRLAAMQLSANGVESALDGFAMAYVRAEVLDGLTPLEREVLTAVSIVEELPPGLAPALSRRPGADDLVRRLAAGNAFVLPVHGRPRVHRLHPLVREQLTADLDRGAPGRAALLHRRAARWFEEHGELETVVRHVAAAGEWDAAATRVVEGRGLADVVAGTPTGVALAEELADLPGTGTPAATVLRAAIALQRGDHDEARAALDDADDGSGVGAPLVRTAWSDAVGEPSEVLAAAAEARSRMDRLDRADPLVIGIVATAQGTARLRSGDLDVASAALDEAVAVTEGTDGPLRLRCLAELSLVEACAGRLTHALELVGAAEELATEQRVPTTARPVALELARAWVALERQDLAQARRSLDRAVRVRAAQDDDTWRAITLLLRVRYLRDRGDAPNARRHLGRAGPTSPWLRALMDIEAHGLAPSSGTPAPASPDSPVVELLEDADHRCRAGDVGAARSAVGQALQLGSTERLRRPFAHASPQVRTMLRSDSRVRAKAAWLRTEAPGAADPADPDDTAAEPVVQALTERETQVLRLLAAFLTTQEIAAEMFISVNTVRTHVRRVLEKLAVSRRNEAVRRGRELGLV